MEYIIPLIAGFVLGCLVTLSWIQARGLWKNGRTLMRRPQEVKSKSIADSSKAREGAAQGRRLLYRALLFYLITGLLMLLFGLIFTSVLRISLS